MSSIAMSVCVAALAMSVATYTRTETRQAVSVVLTPVMQSGQITNVDVVETVEGYSADAGGISTC
jgi:hypothetical protein